MHNLIREWCAWELSACVLFSKVYTGVGGMKGIPWLSTFTGDNTLAKFADYLHVQPDKPWYDYYLFKHIKSFTILACIEQTAEYSNGVRTVMYKYGNEQAFCQKF